MISRLGIVIKNERKVNEKFFKLEHGDGIKIKRDKIGMPCTHSTVNKTSNSGPRESTLYIVAPNDHETAQSP